MRMLNVGDKVITEFNRNMQPRWQYKRTGGIHHLVDTGYSGKMVGGVVVAIESDVAHIDCYIDGDPTAFRYDIAVEGHPAFQRDQWNLPGFTNKIVKPKPIVFCTCGSHATYGINNGAHSHWCDLRRSA